MNIVKFYKKDERGFVHSSLIRVTQTKREIYREISQKATLTNPSGFPKTLPPKYPTVGMADKGMMAQGWSRVRPR